jgi:chromosome segregation ATPase
LDELKAELEAAKHHVQEAEEEKINHSQKLKDFKLNLQSLKTKLFSTEKERVKVLHLFISFIKLRLKDICQIVVNHERSSQNLNIICNILNSRCDVITLVSFLSHFYWYVM